MHFTPLVFNFVCKKFILTLANKAVQFEVHQPSGTQPLPTVTTLYSMVRAAGILKVI